MIYFKNTIIACPEYYDVLLDDTDEIIGNIRLRWGILIAKIKGKIIYEHNFHDDFKGCFDDDIERNLYLGIIEQEIIKHLTK